LLGFESRYVAAFRHGAEKVLVSPDGRDRIVKKPTMVVVMRLFVKFRE
jgi:hypothetical protein